MMERLVDWCDQEFGNGDMNYRHAMYVDALTNITDELREVAKGLNMSLADPELAARFWLEGLLGHARLEGSLNDIDHEANHRWARAYSEFFFAGLRHTGAITGPAALP